MPKKVKVSHGEKTIEEYKAAPQQRAFSMQVDAVRNIDEDERTVELSFSSEDPYKRWWGIEVLGHKKSEVNMDRLKDGTAALLVNHDFDDHVGVVKKVWLDGSRGRAIVKLGKSARASEIFQDIMDGIRGQVSVGYMVHEVVLTKEVDDGPNEYRVTDWEPYEISIVSVAADPTVGVGKALEESKAEEVKPIEKGERKMPDEIKENTPSVDIKAERQEAHENAVKVERARINELTAAGTEYDARDIADEVINSGGDIHDFNQKLLERGGFKASKAEDPEIGLSENEVRQFSFVKLLAHLSNPESRSLREAAGFEIECSVAAQDKTRTDARGMVVPFDVLDAPNPAISRRQFQKMQRDMTVGTAVDGGNLVGTDLLAGSFIESLENAMALTQVGATVLTGLNGNIAIPRQTGGTSHYWLAENGTPTEDAATFDQVPMTPKTVGAYTEYSRMLLLQSSIAIEAFVRNELALRLALALDNAGINGSGASNQPLGIRNQSGIGSVAGGTDGLAPAWSHIVKLETEVGNANAAVGRMAYLTNTKVRGKLKETEKFAGGGREIWGEGNNPLNGYMAGISNQVPSNLVKGSSGAVCSSIIFGNFADVLIGMWGGLDLQVNPYSLDTSGGVRVTAFQSADVQVRHPESFATMDDALTD